MFHVSIGGAEVLFEGLKPPKAPRGDGTGPGYETKSCDTVLHTFITDSWSISKAQSKDTRAQKMVRHTHGRNFVVKCGGTPWCETNIVIGSMQK